MIERMDVSNLKSEVFMTECINIHSCNTQVLIEVVIVWL